MLHAHIALLCEFVMHVLDTHDPAKLQLARTEYCSGITHFRYCFLPYSPQVINILRLSR